jgi:hypothetical protein
VWKKTGVANFSFVLVFMVQTISVSFIIININYSRKGKFKYQEAIKKIINIILWDVNVSCIIIFLMQLAFTFLYEVSILKSLDVYVKIRQKDWLSSNNDICGKNINTPSKVLKL